MKEYLNAPKAILFFTCVTLISCGSGKSNLSKGFCPSGLTTDFVENEFSNEELFYGSDILSEGSTLAVADGNQGASFDIDTIILTKFTSPLGDGMGLSYSVHANSVPPEDSYHLLYLDTDNDPNTGEPIGSLGADAIIMEGIHIHDFDAISAGESIYFWEDNNWERHDENGGFGSFFSDCDERIAITASISSRLYDLSGVSVKGVMKLVTVDWNNPNNVETELNS